jgi:peptidyl-prolyl cis-trans isomerase D
MLSRLQQGEKVNVTWQPVKNITRSQHVGLGADLVQLVFQANAAKLPAYVGIQTAENGYALARIDAVKDVAEVDDAKRNRYAQQIAQITGEELLQAYLADAKKHADISMKSFASDEKK